MPPSAVSGSRLTVGIECQALTTTQSKGSVLLAQYLHCDEQNESLKEMNLQFLGALADYVHAQIENIRKSLIMVTYNLSPVYEVLPHHRVQCIHNPLCITLMSV